MMLAEEYGQPMLYSGYAFSSFDAGPYQNQFGVAPVQCVAGVGPQAEYSPDDWICQHRWPSTLAMVEFRKVVGSAPTINIVKGAGVYGFERQGKGFFLANASRDPYSFEVTTGLPAGTYCDVISGGVNGQGTACVGATFTVTETGMLSGLLAAPAALAIHVESRLD
jgi:alpha-amylase